MSYQLSIKSFPVEPDTQQLLTKLYETLGKYTLPKIGLARGRKGRVERGDKLLNPQFKENLINNTFPAGDKTIPRTVQLGFGWRRALGYGILSPTHKYQEIFNQIVEIGKKITPIGMSFNVVGVNHNVPCRKHKDGNNVGASVFLTLGKFTGGGLIVNDVLHSDCSNNVLIFDGSAYFHETETFIGNRYSLVFYNTNPEGCPKEHMYYGEKVIPKKQVKITKR